MHYFKFEVKWGLVLIAVLRDVIISDRADVGILTQDSEVGSTMHGHVNSRKRVFPIVSAGFNILYFAHVSLS